MSPEIAQDRSLFENYRDSYRSAFRRYAEAVEEWMCLQQCANMDSFRASEVHARVRDAHRAYRETRDRFAGLLLETRLHKLSQSWTQRSPRVELLTFVSRAKSLFTNDSQVKAALQHHSAASEYLGNLERL